MRLSGPRAFACAEAVFAPTAPPWRGGQRLEGQLRLAGWPPAPAQAWTFRGPRSYTGQDVVELVLPGSPPLLRALCLELERAGARLARPGELTRRAWLAGKLDLEQVEAVLALTTSEDEREARAALRALEGGLTPRVDAQKEALLQLLAHLEAAIDFSEEELDLRADAALARDLTAVQTALGELGAVRPAARGLPRVVLRGAANAGKSTLFNALVGREAALVSERAGTTRDALSGRWRLPGGEEVELLDTAGLLPEDAPGAGDELERAAGAAAAEAAAGADLVLFLADGAEAGRARAAWEACPRPRLRVLTKRDLAPAGGWPDPAAPADGPGLQVSARSGAGLAELARAVSEALLGASAAAPGTDLLASVRQTALLRQAQQALERARATLEGADPARAELAALEVREALDALGGLTGEVGCEDLLERLFARFCVGK